MKSIPRLQRISAADLDGLITELRQTGNSRLTLYGPRIHFVNPESSGWAGKGIQDSVVYQLKEAVSDLAQQLSTLTQLSSLNLCCDRIDDEGAASLANLIQLTSLNLRNNLIGAAGAATLAGLPQLTSLDLSENLIGDQGADCLAEFKQLTSLNLAMCQIGAVGAASLADLKQLTSLNLRSNQIGADDLAFLKGLTQLTSLDLSYNAISDAGTAYLAGLPQLTALNLESNQIDADGLAFLKGLTQLSSLNLSHNKIGNAGAASLADHIRLNSLVRINCLALANSGIGDEGAASLAALTQLNSLNLASNEIGDVGIISLAALTNLASLDLKSNKMTDIRPLAALSNLKSLVLKDEFCVALYSDNHLLYPSSNIVQQGQEAVLNYLHEIQAHGVDKLYEAKVLILGDACAGKTSLMRRLYRHDMELPNNDEPSKDIDVHIHEFLYSEGKPFRLNVWDFGGQEIYRRSYQFFLTKRSLYILVVDTSNISTTVHDDGLEYWLEIIKAFSDRCPVLIFQNEKSDHKNIIDENVMKVRFPNVMGVYSGNLNYPEAARTLNDAICRKVQQLPHVGDEFPRQWVVIRQKLDDLKKTKPYISQSDYFRLYESHLPKDQTKALLLSQYFHDLGLFLHFQDDPLLSQTVFLQNTWVTEAVSKLLGHESVKLSNGYFDRATCQRVLTDHRYSFKLSELLALMERFELCYKVRDKQPDKWLCPQLLSASIPDVCEEWGRVDDLVLTYHYEFLPQDMISRLMVRMYRYIRDPDRSWARGACFEHRNSQLLARIGSQSSHVIELRARGAERKFLQSVIASELDALNSSFEGLRGKVRKSVPCQCSQCQESLEPTHFTEEELLVRKSQGKQTIECRSHPYENVSVLALLEGFRLDNVDRMDNQELFQSGSEHDCNMQLPSIQHSTTGNHIPTPIVPNITINAGDGSIINTGSFNTSGGTVNLGAFSDQARITSESPPGQLSTENQPYLQDLLQKPTAAVDADTRLSQTSRTKSLADGSELAPTSLDQKKNSGWARRFMPAVRSLSAALTETNKAVVEVSKFVSTIHHLLPLILACFK
jgi:internalin A